MKSIEPHIEKEINKAINDLKATDNNACLEASRFSLESFGLGKKEQSNYKSTNRTEYVIQIGFDFGTSFSKCVYRDLNEDKAFVYVRENTNSVNFLIPSTIVFNNCIFSLNNENSIYPEHGLYFLKIALDKIAKKEFNASLLKRYKAALNEYGLGDLQTFVKTAVFFYLSRTLYLIKKHIIKEYGDFGTNDNDEMFINMAIPVSSAQDIDVKDCFKDILIKSWNIAKLSKIDLNISYENALKEMNGAKTDNSDNSVNVYPEVSANVQAFINSPASSPDPKTLYFFSDTGAGTVDQCCFTYTNFDNNPMIHYFAAKVHNIGSGIIEQSCQKRWGRTLETWKRIKEFHKKYSFMQQVIGKITDDVRLKTNIVKEELIDHLHTGPGVLPKSTIRQYLRIIFTGGGHKTNPYGIGVKSSFKHYTLSEPREIHIPYPSDLKLPVELRDKWIKRLYVAYGLSFLYFNLAECEFPCDTVIKNKNKKKIKIMCSCRGVNKSCIFCAGTGFCFK